MSSGHIGDAGDGPELASRVSELLAPHWPFYRDRLRIPTGNPAEVTLDRLARPEETAVRLADFARTRPGQDIRGMASLWIQWYLVTAWPPVLAAVLLLGRRPDLDPGRTALVIDDEAKPEAIAIEAETGVSNDPAALLEALVHGQGASLIDGMSRAAGMAPRVGWSNAANVLGWFLAEAAAIADPDALAPGWRLLRQRRRPGRAPNPLCIADFGKCSSDGRPGRRVCCLRYLLDCHSYCADCPVPLHRRREKTTMR